MRLATLALPARDRGTRAIPAADAIPSRRIDHLDFAVPPALVLAIGGITSFASREPLMHAAIVVLAAVLTAAFHVSSVARVRSAARSAIVRASEEAAEAAGARIDAVARQFSWARADIERLAGEVRVARADRAAASIRAITSERRAKALGSLIDEMRERLRQASPADAAALAAETPGATLRLFWGLHDDGFIQWLQVEGGTWASTPTHVRVIDREGFVVAISHRSLAADAAEQRPLGAGARRGLASLVFQVPSPVLEALRDDSEDAYRFEALVDDDTWRPVRMIDSGCRSSWSGDKRWRARRVTRQAASA